MPELDKTGQELQKITKNCLLTTCFAEGSADYQRTQLSNIINMLGNSQESIPKLLEFLENDGLVVPTSGISRTQMENIGVSSTLCLKYIQQTAAEKHGVVFSSDDHRRLVIVFLTKAIQQAQAACKKFEQDTDSYQESPSYDKVIHMYFQDTVDDIKKRCDLLASDLDGVKKEALEANKGAILAKKIARDASLSTKRAEKRAEAIVPNMLTILGIFVAIIIAVVSCYLNILLSKYGVYKSGNYIRPLEFMQYILMGHIISFTIFSLLYLVSKLTSRSLACFCKDFVRIKQSSDKDSFDCTQCDKNCSPPKRFRLRYPYVLWINIIFAIVYAVLWIWQVINVYYRGYLDNLIASYPAIFGVIFFVIALIPIGVAYFAFKKEK